MAILVETQEQELDNEALALGLSQDKNLKPDDDDGLPEKFKGKGKKDIADAYVNLEKELGRQAKEVGDLRKLADTYLKETLAEKQNKPKVEEINDEDFFTNPKETIRKAVDQHPEVLAAKQYSQEAKKFSALAALKEAHSDYPTIVADPEFQGWVQKSKVRTQLAIQADKGFDSDAAIELFDLWKEIKEAKKTSQVKQEQTEIRKETLSKAGVSGGGTAGESSKKIYRRADLIKLKMTDPDRYTALADDIYKAYQEGRVK